MGFIGPTRQIGFLKKLFCEGMASALLFYDDHDDGKVLFNFIFHSSSKHIRHLTSFHLSDIVELFY